MMYAPHDLVTRPTVGSDRVDQSKRGKVSGGEVEMIHMALECVNDQLRAIVEWSARALANDTIVC